MKRIKYILIAALVAFLALIGLWQLSKARQFQVFGTVVARVDTDLPLVALTFDDGPTRAHTQTVLDLLARHDAPATFFLTGAEALRHPDLVRAIIDAGHAVGNHSLSHERMVGMTPARMHRELEITDAALAQAGWTGPRLFRPPYGKRLFVLPWILWRSERTTVMWDVAPDDVNDTAQAIAQRAIDGARPGSILLPHPMYDSRQATRDALPLLIEGLRARGFRLVTVTQLLAESGNGA